MTETTKRMLIAGIAAAVLIGGSVTAIALSDSDDDRDSVVAAAGFDDRGDDEGLLGELFERFGDGDGRPELGGLLDEIFRGLAGLEEGELRDRLRDFFGSLRDDLMPLVPEGEAAPAPPFGEGAPEGDRHRDVPRRFDRDDDQALPFEGFGFHFGPGEEGFRFFGPGEDGFGFRFGPGEEGFEFFGPGEGFRFFGEGELDEKERDKLRKELEKAFDEFFGNGQFGFGFGFPGQPFVVPGIPFDGPGSFEFFAPFGELPLDEFLSDGRITPDEARELERLYREGLGDRVPEFGPPLTDRAPALPEGLFEALRALPFREFFADGELTPREREVLRDGLNTWLDGIFERFDSRG